MKITSTFIIALLGIQPLIAEEPTIESLSRRIEILEQKVAKFSTPASASSPEVPMADAREKVIQGEIVVDVLVDGSIQIEGKKVDDAEVSKRLKAVAEVFPNQPLRIRADDQTKYENVVRVIDLCQKSGIWDISFATRTTLKKPEMAMPEPTKK